MDEVAINKLESLNLLVKVSRQFRIRAWLAIPFLKLAALILGGKATVEIS